MITVETIGTESKKQIAALESELKIANETIKQLQEKPRLTLEEQVRLSLIDNRISYDSLKTILNKQELEDRFELGNLILKRIFLGGGAYCIE